MLRVYSDALIDSFNFSLSRDQNFALQLSMFEIKFLNETFILKYAGVKRFQYFLCIKKKQDH